MFPRPQSLNMSVLDDVRFNARVVGGGGGGARNLLSVNGIELNAEEVQYCTVWRHVTRIYAGFLVLFFSSSLA